MFKHYLKTALRNLLKYKTQSIISALCLAVGISCFCIINYLIVEICIIEFKKELPDYNKLFLIYKTIDKNEERNNHINYNYIKGLESYAIPEMEDYFYHTCFINEGHNRGESMEMDFIDLSQKKSTYIVKNRYVNASFFSFNNCKLLYGDRVPRQPNEIVISKSFAQRAFGEKNPVGIISHFTIDEASSSLTIVNVTEDLKDTGMQSDIYLCDANEDCYMLAYGKLKDGYSMEQLNRSLSQIKDEENGVVWHLKAELLSDNSLTKEDIIIISIITLIASLILLSGLINFLKFIIQQFYNRQRELALRRSMGSNAKGVFMLLFSEVLWMLTIAFAFSLLTSEWTTGYLNDIFVQENFSPIEPATLIMQQLYLYFALLIVCMAIIVMPVMHVRYVNLLSNLQGQNSNRHLFRNLMIGLQLTIGIFFLGTSVGLSILLKQNSGVANPPFDKDEMERIVSVNPNSITFKRQMPLIITGIKQLAQVEDILLLPSGLFDGSYTITYQMHNDSSVNVRVYEGSPNYFSFMNIPCQGDSLTGNSIYVNDQFANILREDSAGGEITLGDNTFHIAGQYKQLYEAKLNGLVRCTMFVPYNGNTGTLIVKGRDGITVKQLKELITQVCRRYVPDTLPLSIVTWDKKLNDENSSKIGSMLYTIGTVLTFISLLLVVVSIYSSISMDTMRRRKEIAIRKINGATPAVIARLFARPYILIVIISYLFATPMIYLIINNIIGQFNERIFGVVQFLLLFIAVVLLVAATLTYKIWRIMHINPAEVIKRQ